jgi:hypothetical protein
MRPQGPYGLTAARTEARLVAACLPAVHAANPRARVALGPLASRGAEGGAPPLEFFATYRRAGGPEPDAIALNPYLRGLAPQYRPTEIPADGAITLRNLDVLQRDVRRVYGRAKPFWLTEFAVRTGPTPGLGNVTASRQAALARQSITLVRRHYRYVSLFVWFLLRDESPTGYWRSGLVDFAWNQRPVWRVWSGGGL